MWFGTLRGGSFEEILDAVDACAREAARDGGERVCLVGPQRGRVVGAVVSGGRAGVLAARAPYDGARFVDALITLGAPHGSLEKYPFGRVRENRPGESEPMPDDARGSSARVYELLLSGRVSRRRAIRRRRRRLRPRLGEFRARRRACARGVTPKRLARRSRARRLGSVHDRSFVRGELRTSRRPRRRRHPDRHRARPDGLPNTSSCPACTTARRNRRVGTAPTPPSRLWHPYCASRSDDARSEPPPHNAPMPDRAVAPRAPAELARASLAVVRDARARRGGRGRRRARHRARFRALPVANPRA